MSAIAFIKKVTVIASSLVLVFSLQGCPWVEPHYHFDYEIIVTETPANLEGLNSVYNDYNSICLSPEPEVIYILYGQEQ